MSRKFVLGIIISTAAINFCGFLYYLFLVMSFFRDLTTFSALTVFFMVLTIIGLFIHLMLYVHFMDLNVKKFKIEDEEDWHKKWDYDFKN